MQIYIIILEFARHHGYALCIAKQPNIILRIVMTEQIVHDEDLLSALVFQLLVLSADVSLDKARLFFF